MLFAMTLPALVIALFVLGMVELARDRRRGRQGTAMASTGFDLLQEALYPCTKYAIEQRAHEALAFEEDSDAAPPRSRIDLDAGTAHLRLPD